MEGHYKEGKQGCATGGHICRRSLNAHQHESWVAISGITAGGGGGRGGRVPLWHFSPGNFCWPTRKREANKNGKMEKKRKSKKGMENLKWKGEKLQNEKMRRGFFFFFFLIIFYFFFFLIFNFFFCCFSLFKTTEFVLGLPKWKFSTRKKAFHATGKKSGKMTLPPLKNKKRPWLRSWFRPYCVCPRKSRPWKYTEDQCNAAATTHVRSATTAIVWCVV